MEDGYTNWTLRMREDERDEWNEAVEKSDQFNTLSQLVRYSVQQEIRRIEDRQEGEMTKEEREVLDKIKAEHAQTRDVLSEIRELTEQINSTTITTPEAEAILNDQTHQIEEIIEALEEANE